MATGFLHQRIPNGIRKATTDYGQRHIVETAIVIAGVAGTEFKSLGSESVIKHADGRNVLNGLNWRFAAAVDAERLMLPHSLKASHLVLCLPHILPGVPHQPLSVSRCVGFRTPASPAAIRSAFMIEADQTLTAAACLLMTQAV